MKKIGKMNEIGWAIAVLLCALGVSLCTKAGFGLSMVASPGYVIHLYMRDIFPWYSQGTSEYIWQGFQLIILCIAIRRCSLSCRLPADRLCGRGLLPHDAAAADLRAGRL